MNSSFFDIGYFAKKSTNVNAFPQTQNFSSFEKTPMWRTANLMIILPFNKLSHCSLMWLDHLAFILTVSEAFFLFYSCWYLTTVIVLAISHSYRCAVLSPLLASCPTFKWAILIVYLLLLCVRVYRVVHEPRHACNSQRTTWWTWLSFTFTVTPLWGVSSTF